MNFETSSLSHLFMACPQARFLGESASDKMQLLAEEPLKAELMHMFMQHLR